MAISFVAASALADGSAGTVSLAVAKYAGNAANDIAFVHLVIYQATYPIVAPPDNSWHRIPVDTNQSGNNTPYNFVFWHVVTGSEPASWKFNLSASAVCAARSVGYSGAKSFRAVGVTTGTNTTALAGAVAGAVAGDVLLQFIAADDSTASSPTITLDASLTSRYSGLTADNKLQLVLGDDASPTNASKAYSNTITHSAAWCVPVIIISASGSVPTEIDNYGIVGTGTTVQTAANSTSINGTVPAGTQNADLLVAFFVNYNHGDTIAITSPAGWTKVREDQFSLTGTHGVNIAGIYTHPVTTSAEPATYTWSISGSGSGVNTSQNVSIVTARGVTGVDATSMLAPAGNVSSVTPPAITPASDNELILYCGAWSNAGGSTIQMANYQRETFAQGSGIFSGLGGLANVASVTPAILNGVIADGAIGYQVGLTPTTIQTTGKFLGSAQINTFTGASQAITIPTTPSATKTGDVLIGHVVVGTAITITPPSGWSAIPGTLADDGTNAAQAFSHTVAGGDPASVTFTFSGSTTGCMSVSAWRNVTATFATSNSTTQGLTPSLSGIGASSTILYYEMCETTGGVGALGYQAVEILGTVDTCATILAYNNGTTTLGGKLSILPQTGPTGGAVAQLFRAAHGSTSGPQMTIAMLGSLPVTPVTPSSVNPPPGGGPAPNLPFTYVGRISALPSFPPVKSFHEVNLLLQKKLNDIATLQQQIVKYASSPQQHYQIPNPSLPTTSQYDTNQALLSNETVPAYQSADTGTYFPSTGFVSTLGPAATATNVNVPSATPTTLATASPNIAMNTGDLVMVVINGTWAAGMFGKVMDVVYSGNASSITYFNKRINTDAGGNFSDTQIFAVPAGVAGDTSVSVGTTQATGGAVVVTTVTVYAGNLQAR